MDLTDDDYRVIRRVAQRQRSSSVDADDLVQEAAIRLWREEYDSTKGPRVAFVASRARYAMLDFLGTWTHSRRIAEHRTVYLAPDELPEPSALDDHDAIDARMDMRRALRRLPQRARKMVVMRYLLGLTVPEVERRLGLAPQSYHYLLREDASSRVPAGTWSRPSLAKPHRAAEVWIPRASPRERTPEKLRELAGDMPTFLATLPVAVRADAEAWLAGHSIEEIAQRVGLRVGSVRSNIGRAFERARQRS